jgi:hypothetical protein
LAVKFTFFETALELKNTIAYQNVVGHSAFDVLLNPLFGTKTLGQKEPSGPLRYENYLVRNYQHAF